MRSAGYRMGKQPSSCATVTSPRTTSLPLDHTCANLSQSRANRQWVARISFGPTMQERTDATFDHSKAYMQQMDAVWSDGVPMTVLYRKDH